MTKKYFHRLNPTVIYDVLYEDEEGVLLQDRKTKNRFCARKELFLAYYKEVKEPRKAKAWIRVLFDRSTNKVFFTGNFSTYEDAKEVKSIFELLDIIEISWEEKV